MASPRFLRSRNFKVYNWTGGNLTLNSTSWADLPTISSLADLRIRANVDDWIEVQMSMFVGDQVSSVLSLDAFFVVSGVVSAQQMGSSTRGVVAWMGGGTYYSGNVHSSHYHKVRVADLDANVVHLRPRYKVSTGNRTLFGSPDYVPGFQFMARNVGPSA